MTADRPTTEPRTRAEGLDVDAHVCRTCGGLHYHDDVARERVCQFVKAWQSFNNPGDEVYRIYRDGQEYTLFVDDLALLSRLSDEVRDRAMPDRPTTEPRAADRLRDKLLRGRGWPDELVRDLDEALAEAATAERERAERLPSVERLTEILDEAEDDGIIGPDYTPPRLAEYILAALTGGPSDE